MYKLIKRDESLIVLLISLTNIIYKYIYKGENKSIRCNYSQLLSYWFPIRLTSRKKKAQGHFISIRTVIIKKGKITSIGKDVEKLEPSCIAGRNI